MRAAATRIGTMAILAILVSAASLPGSAVAQTGEQDRLAGLKQVVWSPAAAARYAAGRATAVPPRVWDHPRSVVAVGISPDGRFAVTGSWESAKVWNLRTGEQVHEWKHRFPAYVTAVAFSPDGTLALTGAADGSARLWAVEEGAMLQQWSHWKDVEDLGFSQDGSLAVTVAADRTAKVWSVASGELLREMTHPDTVRAVAFTPDGARIVTGCMDRVARLWDVQSGRLLREWPQGGPVVAVAVSRNGRLALTGNGDGTARLLDLAGGTELAQLKHEKFVYATAFSRDGSLALTASADGTARLWDVAKRETIRSFQHEALVTRALFSPDESLILTASTDKSVRLWDARSGKQLERWAHENSVHAIAFSADGRLVLTGSNDRKARLFDAARHFQPAATLEWLRQRAGTLLDFNLRQAGVADQASLPAWRRNQIAEYAFFSAFGSPIVRGTSYDAASQRMSVEIGSDSPVATQIRYRLTMQDPVTPDRNQAVAAALQAGQAALAFAWDGASLQLAGGMAEAGGTQIPLTIDATTATSPSGRFPVLPTGAAATRRGDVLPASGPR